MEKQTHRYVQSAIEAGNLNEVVRLCWRDIKASKAFCSAQVLCLARVLTYFDDQEGLTLLREAVRERIRRDKHYQPPFQDGRDDLLWRLDCGIEEGRFLQRVAGCVGQTPAITRSALYGNFSVFKDKRSKLSADKLKPQELRSEDWMPERQFEQSLFLVPSIERASNEKFRVIDSEGSDPSETFHLREFERPNLRPSPPLRSKVRSVKPSYIPIKGTQDTPIASSGSSNHKRGCALTALCLATIGMVLVLWLQCW